MVMDESFYKRSEYFHLFAHSVMKANHKDKEILVDGKTMLIKRGQFLTSRKKLAEETGINESNIQRILKFLENERHIEQQTTNKYRLITVLKYNKYQNPERPCEQQDEQQLNSKRTASEQQLNTTNKDNNGNNGINSHGHYCIDSEFEKFWEHYPKKKHKDMTKEIYNRVVKECGPDVLLRALAGYMNYKTDEARRTGDELDPKYFKNPENFLGEGAWKDYVDYTPLPPPL